MKSMRTLTFLAVFALVALPVIAHHPAADIVDEEIYAMIDEMVSDTPHATMVFDDDMGGGMTQTDISAQIKELEDIIADGLLRYTALLDGDVTLSIDFTTGKALSMTIIQVEVPAESDDAISDKALGDVETMTFGELKASYR
jgi:hypothetical protein